jgi:predicted nucleic acid-binding protein
VTRVFCDANVLFAAAISPEGRSSALFVLAARGDHELLASPHVLEEARRNVSARHAESVDRLDGTLIPQLRVVSEAAPDLVAWARERGLPAGDAPVLAAAVQSGADALTTGDRTHFGHLFGRRSRGVKVVTLREAVALLSGS